ncbi:excinuclease ABC subunit UvrB [Candidatus Poribacteria bacterium]|nr:excinuclease ABC subunit UvrB [Candidatus Poribacteria bacterium]MYG07145.1 excinuclease ABC subunit UvrB [Candidatus Poribacteria bacterium]MYK22348.1 excinuclease ABC subunit UvrB [Candidatus Poribacteria bacterium]
MRENWELLTKIDAPEDNDPELSEQQFELISDFSPQGDQPQAIDQLTEGLRRGNKAQTLLGVTGSGKTYTMANVIQNVQLPTLVISPNKTLAAQLYNEFRTFFPNNTVHYFVSDYEYYQPEAYIPSTDTFIEKDVRINEEITRMRLASTASLISRSDVIVVASVSCLYGLGSPDEFENQRVQIEVGEVVRRDALLRALVDIQYVRNDVEFWQGVFRARGDVVEVFPAYSENAYRIELFGDEIDRISEIDTTTGEIIAQRNFLEIYPAKHFMTDGEIFDQALVNIELELQDRILTFEKENKLLEAQRIEQRTRFDLEMLREVGYCSGIENYSRHLSGLQPGDPPYCLMHYFPDDFLLFIDESHVTIPQLRGMYRGDRSRKETLVSYGFRLPSALDNRPLRFDEVEARVNQVIFVSATPGPYEMENSAQIVEQIIRPTGLIDPEITIHPVKGQIDHLIGRIKERVKRKQRVLVTTLTKRMSEDLTEYLTEAGIRADYMHSEIDVFDRARILRQLREGVFDVLVGINLLREGLDLPEVSLVAILDADRPGFLRSVRSLVQTAGRAARNVDGEVILYGDNVTEAMDAAMKETRRRREIQLQYNTDNNITPATIQKAIQELIAESGTEYEAQKPEQPPAVIEDMAPQDIEAIITDLTRQMRKAALDLDYEEAAALRDRIAELKAQSAKQ